MGAGHRRMSLPEQTSLVGGRPVTFRTAIAAHLDAILSSAAFKAADSLRELLRFTVHETLAGRGDELKEYVLGSTVLRKGEAFDPKADGIVRVQMRRLRERLAQYYAAEGRAERLRIEIPKGTYAPVFRVAGLQPGTTDSRVVDSALIVGRDEVLAGLRATLESSAAGRGALFCLSGEPGIGKTAVVEAFLRELRESDTACYVGRGRCSERLAGSEAYLPLLEALEDLSRDADEQVRELMSTFAPHWHLRTAPAPDSAAEEHIGGSPAASQEHLKRELVAFIGALAQRQPVVMFLDDLHWADASTVDVLAYWANRCTSQRVLIAATYRPSELLRTNHPFVRAKLELQGHGICHETAMTLLTRDDVETYLSLRFPEHAFPRALSARIYERTEGNPLFMVDLLRFLRDRGVLSALEGRWTMTGELPVLANDLPESVRSLIERKIGDLDDADRMLMSAAAVQGYEFDAAVVARVLGRDPTDTEERLESLDRIHGFIRLLDGRALPDNTFTLRYTFVHVLYQNALYASLRPTQKVSWSAAVAQALLDYHGADSATIASELAILFEAARDFGQAADYFLLAAQRAAAQSANKEAVALARRGLNAITLWPETPDRAQRELHLQTTLGPALMSTIGYGSPEVEAAYVRARELCAQVGEMPRLFTVIYGLYQYWLARADYRTCRVLAEQLLTLAQKLDDPTVLIPAHSALGNTLCFSGAFDAARTHGEQLVTMYVPSRHHALAALYSGFDLGVGSRGGIAVSTWALGYPDRAVASAESGIALARDLAHTSSLALALNWTAMVHQHRRDPTRTREHAEAAIALAEEELAPWLAWATMLRGWAMAVQGEHEEGIAQLRRGLTAWTSAGLRCLEPYFLSLLAAAHAAAAQPDAALAAVVKALAITDQTGEGYAEAELHRLKGELLGDSEEAEAEACYRRAIAVSRAQRARSLELRAATSLRRLERVRGTSTASGRTLSEIYGGFTEGFDTIDAQEARALL
jgi:predicted ATPase